MQQITYPKLFGLHLFTSRIHSYVTSQAGTMQKHFRYKDFRDLSTNKFLKPFLRPPNTAKFRFDEWFLSMYLSVCLSAQLMDVDALGTVSQL